MRLLLARLGPDSERPVNCDSIEADLSGDGDPEALVFFGIRENAHTATRRLVDARGFCILAKGGSSWGLVALLYPNVGGYVLRPGDSGMVLLRTGSVVITEDRWRWVPGSGGAAPGKWVAETRPAFTGEWRETGRLIQVE
jgi:hypothetical protein